MFPFIKSFFLNNNFYVMWIYKFTCLGMRDAQLFEVTADMAELCKECNNYCPLNGLKHKDEEPANPAQCCDTILTNVDDIVKGSRYGRGYKTR